MTAINQEIEKSDSTTRSDQELKSSDKSDNNKTLDELYEEVKKLKDSAESTIKEVREQRGILFLGYIICILMVGTIFITFLIFLFDKVSQPSEQSAPYKIEYLSS